MRRKDREIAGFQEIWEIMTQCAVCRVAMADGDRPYVVPMNFGAERVGDSAALYLHCAKEGRKLEILGKNPRVCVEMDCEHKLVSAEKACGYGFAFASVIGEGTARLLADPAEKAHGLSVLMKHQTGREFSFTQAEADSVAVLRVDLDALSGKRKA